VDIVYSNKTFVYTYLSFKGLICTCDTPLKIKLCTTIQYFGLMCTYGDFKCILARDLKKIKIVICILIMCKEDLRYMEHIHLGLYNSSQGH
jgi:hypothetical protein